jgi:beta-glucosidase
VTGQPSTDARIEAWLAALTLDEKAALVAGTDLWHTAAVPRLGIPVLRMSDGPVGVRGTRFRGGPRSACFPCGAALGASWDPELVGRVAGALAEEARDKGAGLLLGPTVNLQRTPIGGRNFECYSEDPHLTARLAAAYVRGLQAGGVGACVKHFAANDVEWDRHRASVEIGERALRELVLPPFEAAVCEAGAWSVMAAYNRLNGVHCTEHPALLGAILRGEWGFDGVVVSDWLATRSTAPSLRAGLDLEMPGPPRRYGPALAEAIRRGDVPADTLDTSVRRMLRLLVRTGAADAPDGPAPETGVDRPAHRALAREAAAAGLVLLRNAGGLLPLDSGRLRRLAVIGPNADRAVLQGGGSAGVRSHEPVSPLSGIRARAGAAVHVAFERGCSAWRSLPALDARHLEASGGEARWTLELFDGPEAAGTPVRVEGVDEVDLLWLTPPTPLVPGRPFAARVRGRLLAPAGGPHRFSLTSTGRARLRVDGHEVVDAWSGFVPGSAFFGLGSAEIEGRAELRGGTGHDVEIEYRHERPALPAGLRAGWLAPEPHDALERAVAAARDADAAVLVVGLDAEWETEGRDREDFALPGRQDELVEAVAAANPRTIVVVNAGSPVAMDWGDRVPALLQLWYPGEEGGHALADVLFGDVDPGGRLPLTIPRRLEDSPAFLCHPGERATLLQGEGVFVGYRGYDARAVEPRFPFGHGLSYARFEYGPLRASPVHLVAGESLEASVEVTNVSARPGREVVQLYVGDLAASVRRPPRELRGFARLDLAPGEARTVRFVLGPRDFSFWDPALPGWAAEPGAFELAVGRSSRDLRARARVVLGGGDADA